MRISDWSSDVCSSDLIGNADSLRFPIIGNDSQHGPENFLARDAIAIVDVGKDRRLDKITMVTVLRTPAAGHEPPFVLADRDIGFDAVAVRGRDRKSTRLNSSH